MEPRKDPLKGGVILVAAGIGVVLAWIGYDLWSTPRSTGLEIKDGAVLSVVPTIISLVCISWGLALIGRELWKRRSR